VKDTPLLKLLVERWIMTKRQEIEILRRDIEPSPKQRATGRLLSYKLDSPLAFSCEYRQCFPCRRQTWHLTPYLIFQ
jgi:hypothetical protein